MSRKQLARSGGDLAALGTDDTGCTMLHLDMDAFFVSVELLTRPELLGTPVIVGGRAGRGVCVSASYEARAYGVHAAMPMSQAVRRCPQATVIPPSRGAYSHWSRAVFDVIAEVTDEFAKVSVDEGYIDVASAVRRLGSPRTIAAGLRAEIRARTGLIASIGAASTMVVAKLASARAKPDGLLVVPAADTRRFLDPMPIEALPGVGAKTQATLARYGITTIGQFAETDADWAAYTLGAFGAALHGYARGIDARTVHDTAKEHSVSNETTFPADILDPARLERELLRLADEVAGRLRKERIVAGTVGLKYRLHDFRTFSRQVALPAPTDVAAEIHAALVPLLRRLNAEHREPVRLLGLRASDVIDLQDAGRQSTLDAPERSPRDAEVALDEVRRKFGAAIIGQASLLEPRGTDAGGAGGGGAGGDAGGGGAGGTDAG